jgi:hypothetical protein
MIAESTLLNLIWEGYKPSPLHGLLQHLAIVPANCFLLLGLLAMWWAYHRVGLGFTIERRDYAVMAGILALMLAILAFREHLTEARSPYLISRYLQQAGLVVLLVTAAVSVVLHRMAVQMDGGKLALALRCLTLYVLLRAALVLLQQMLKRSLLAEWDQPFGLNHYFFDLCWQAVPWMAALGAAYRAQLTVTAAKELAHWRAVRAAVTSV